MRAEHPSVPWYSAQLQTPSAAPTEIVKQEVVAPSITEASVSAPSSLTLADIMAGPIPTGLLPLHKPVSAEPPPPQGIPPLCGGGDRRSDP